MLNRLIITEITYVVDVRGVKGMDIIRASDHPKRLIIRLDSFFGYPQNFRISDSDITVRITDMDMR
jgi:hypothetical protein